MSAHRRWGDATRAVHAGLAGPEQGRPLLAGPTFASLFHLRGDPEGASYSYGRYGNPTWSAYECALEELEGGPAAVFSSGMAAVSAVMLAHLGPGDVVVVAAGGYMGTRDLARDHLARLGVEVRSVRAGEELGDAIADARLVWLESPSNPALEIWDIAAIAAEAHAAGALVAVDNTSATPLSQRPLELGADFSVCSDTKALTGHSDLVLGHVAASAPAGLEAVRAWRQTTGSIAGPFETWLAHRSLATLELRLDRQCSTAMALAERLSAHPHVVDVRYPGLAGAPDHALAAPRRPGAVGRRRSRGPRSLQRRL